MLVAGASGYLGRYVVRRFKEEGYWVRVLVRDPARLNARGAHLEPAIGEEADDVFVGEITRPETLAGVCDGIDVVFSSVGITRQKDGLAFDDVDYQGNVNLLRAAQRSRTATRFLFVSVYEASRMLHLDIVNARERFVSELAASGLSYAVIRPTGFYSDLAGLLRMAERGVVFLIGDGRYRLNPIHGADLAELAFRSVGRPVRIVSLSPRFVRIALRLLKPFHKRLHGTLSFFAEAMQMDLVAPRHGNYRLKPYFDQVKLVMRETTEGSAIESEKREESKMKTISRMMDHLYWANGRMLDALDASKTENKDILKLARHVAVAEQVWLSRLEGRGSTQYALWEDAEDVATLKKMFAENEKQYRQYIGRLEERNLDEMVEYANQSGVPFRTSVRDILTQVALHGQYHRGQINRALRGDSAEPVQVDFITFARLEQ
ncbi:DinB family protein [Cohnella massiliensis]|uniref:DinB family protein n=1 Tax=Cohnella massiliensis TaxID=1816691 RepID=UPI001FE7DCE2|nr:DinB family protein [Cohnella massiliensis]